jgi:hypothetical protein
VVVLVARQALTMTVGGLVVGLGAAFFLSQSLSKLLYGISTRDARSFLVVPLILMVVSTVSCAAPAWRATRIDPLIAPAQISATTSTKDVRQEDHEGHDVLVHKKVTILGHEDHGRFGDRGLTMAGRQLRAVELQGSSYRKGHDVIGPQRSRRSRERSEVPRVAPHDVSATPARTDFVFLVPFVANASWPKKHALRGRGGLRRLA